MQIKTEIDVAELGMVGLADFTVSINRQWWKNKRSDALQFHHTWRHFTLAFRSPVIWSHRERRFRFNSIRFGGGVDGSGRAYIYFGVIYLMADTDIKRRAQTRMVFHRFGPFEAAHAS